MNRYIGFSVAGFVLMVLGGAAYWREHTLSHDFRKAAVDAVAQLDSFVDVGACSRSPVLYTESVQRLSTAVYKAEAEISTVEDKYAASQVRSYYKLVTDRDKVCQANSGGIAVEVYKSSAHYALSLK